MDTTRSPACPACGNDRCHSHSMTKAGSPRFRCTVCKKVFTISDRGRGQPRSPKPLSNAERQRRFKQKKKLANTEDFMTLPTISELVKGAIVRTSYGEEMRIIDPAIGEVLRTGNGSVSYEPPSTIVTHYRNDLNIWKQFVE